MICGPCREGGELIPMMRRRPAAVRDGVAEHIDLLHKRCSAPTTCPCHHDVTLSAVDRGQPK